MLRTDRKAGFVTEGAWLWKRHRFRAGATHAERAITTGALRRGELIQRDQPVALLEVEGRCWWWFRDRFYWEDDGLEPEDVLALVTERERRKRRQLERAHAAMRQELDGAPRRAPIARAVRLAVWERDGGRCVECGGEFELQYDHVIPFSMGGASTVENLQLLCAGCNREKGGSL